METIEDIVREMREGVKDCDGEYIQEIDDFADRIEAAYKRLVDSLKKNHKEV